MDEFVLWFLMHRVELKEVYNTSEPVITWEFLMHRVELKDHFLPP